MKREVEVQYEEVSLQNVLQFFADKFEMQPGKQVMRRLDGSAIFNYFVDVGQGTVVFKLYIEPSRETPP